MRRKRAFTLIELLVVISIIALLIGILLPALGAARRTARQMQNSTQVRGIQQGHILFSQGNGTYYAGLTSTGYCAPAIAGTLTAYGATAGDPVSIGFAQLLNGNFFTPGYLLNPAETDTNINTLTLAAANVIKSTNSSYASDSVTTAAATTDANSKRSAEFKDNTNTQAPILGDRVNSSAGATTGNVPAANQRSVWTSTDGDWRGSVVFGDNNTQFLTTSTVAVTKFGTVVNTAVDNLFVTSEAADTDANAMFIRGAN